METPLTQVESPTTLKLEISDKLYTEDVENWDHLQLYRLSCPENTHDIDDFEDIVSIT